MWPRCRNLRIVFENIKHLPAKERQDWIWDKIIYANPIKAIETLRELNNTSRW
jgi:ornithine decarboxylase